MTEGKKDIDPEKLSEEIHVHFEAAKKELQVILHHPEMRKKLKYTVAISFLSMLICETGLSSYPEFGSAELDIMLRHIRGCIKDMNNGSCGGCESCESDDKEPSTDELIDALNKAASGLKNGTAKISTVKLEA